MTGGGPVRLTRRRALGLALGAAIAPRPGRAQPMAGWSLPIRNPGGVAGDGFTIRCAYAAENLAHHPGWYHTAEDWHRDGTVDSAGAEVLAVAAGEVAYADFDYPGRVVAVRHAADLYSVYGHLDYALDVVVGQKVAAGQVLGRVLAAAGWRAENHLHVEVRTFLIAETINGSAPRHGVTCGYQCVPGPGYWPQGAEHPSVLGWRNPTHLIHGELAAAGTLSEALVTAAGAGQALALRSEPRRDAPEVASLGLVAGARYPLRAIDAGDPASLETSALGYRVWYRLAPPGGAPGWAEVAIPDATWAGQDGRPSAVRLLMVPAGA
jgi:hypothetical protein